jgi:hypothetical protein
MVALVLGASVLLLQPPPLTQSPIASGPDTTVIDDSFLTVPYTPPLAPGETLHIAVAEISGAELEGLGLDWNDADPGAVVLAEVVSGEDDMPRAVRVLNEIAN